MTFQLGAERSWGEVTCGFGFNGPECFEAATRHVLWLPDLATSNTCDEHMEFIRQNAEISYEVHAFGHDCGMPGTWWHHPYEDEPEGYCFFPAPDDAALLVAERQEVQR